MKFRLIASLIVVLVIIAAALFVSAGEDSGDVPTQSSNDGIRFN